MALACFDDDQAQPQGAPAALQPFIALGIGWDELDDRFAHLTVQLFLGVLLLFVGLCFLELPLRRTCELFQYRLALADVGIEFIPERQHTYFEIIHPVGIFGIVSKVVSISCLQLALCNHLLDGHSLRFGASLHPTRTATKHKAIARIASPC